MFELNKEKFKALFSEDLKYTKTTNIKIDEDLKKYPYLKTKINKYEFFINENKIGHIFIFKKLSNEPNPYTPLYGIRVGEKYRSKGYGKKLINIIKDIYKTPIYGFVDKDNKESIEFHKKIGTLIPPQKYLNIKGWEIYKNDLLFKI